MIFWCTGYSVYAPCSTSLMSHRALRIGQCIRRSCNFIKWCTITFSTYFVRVKLPQRDRVCVYDCSASTCSLVNISSAGFKRLKCMIVRSTSITSFNGSWPDSVNHVFIPCWSLTECCFNVD
jgi:hypothetical protein